MQPSKARRWGRDVRDQEQPITAGPSPSSFSRRDFEEGWKTRDAELVAGVVRAKEEFERYRYLPASYQLKDQIDALSGQAGLGDLIEKLVKAVAYEATEEEE